MGATSIPSTPPAPHTQEKGSGAQPRQVPRLQAVAAWHLLFMLTCRTFRVTLLHSQAYCNHDIICLACRRIVG